MARKPIAVSDIRPFLEKTGQLHLLDGLSDATGKHASCLPAALLPPSGGSDTPQGVKKGKMRMKMTKTEEEFSRILDARKIRGEISHWLYEPITLRWGVLDILRYTPDFVTFDLIEVIDDVPRLSMRLIEVKGSYIHNESRAMRTFKEARNHWHGTFCFELWQKTKEEGWQQIY